MKKERSNEPIGASRRARSRPCPRGWRFTPYRRTHAFAGKFLARSGVHVFDANN
jgi:hypothetical protein